jgi:hypothetical protein
MSTGGARYGAGRPAYKIKANELCSLDIRRIARQGHLRYDHAFTKSWQCYGKHYASIEITVREHSHLTLRYTTTQNGQNRNVVQPVALQYTPCHFGKPRPWLACPHCYQRVAILYLRWDVFRCRTCQRATYASQSETPLRQLWRKQRKIEAKLTGEDWQRPKGMHRSTYAKLANEVCAVSMLRNHEMNSFFGNLLPDIRRSLTEIKNNMKRR